MNLVWYFGVCSFLVSSRVKAESLNSTLDNVTQGFQRLKRVETVNDLGDVILRNLRFLMNEYNINPFLIPDQKKSVIPVNLALHDIQVYNLTTVQRASNLIMFDDAINRQMETTLTLKFDYVILVCDYHLYVKVLPFAPKVGSKGILTAVIPEITVDIKIIVNFKDINATLSSLKLSTNRTLIKVKLTGNLERYALNVAMPIMVRILQDVILKFIEKPLRKHVNTVLYAITGMINGFFLSDI